MNERPELAIADDGFKAMGGFEKQTKLDGDTGRLLGRERAPRDHGGQVFSIEILHRHVITGFMVAVLKDSGYVFTDLTQLLLKLRPQSLCRQYLEGIVVRSVRDKLQRDAPLRSRIACQEHGPCHAMADRLDDLVRSELLEYGLHHGVL